MSLAPVVQVALVGAVLALAPLAWVLARHRRSGRGARLHALTVLTLFLTFDLVLFGAFTRLTDSGLGCPDWPGCYGSASPLGAREHIAQAQAALPGGPVTHGKAWIEMIHRYLATAVGGLILVLTWWSWRGRTAGGPSPWWTVATLAWVCAQGAFGALTVTMKLYPAIVTAHLLGGIGLLVLLAAQAEAYTPRQVDVSRGLWRGLWAVAALLLVQIALGGWVSTNYAVLACRDFPQCQGAWWPQMDFEHGFTLRRELGSTAGGEWLPFAALTAIHYTHRLASYVVLAALLVLAWRLRAAGHGRYALGVLAGGAWQLLSGLSNVVLGWPLPAAVAHTAGAAALAVLLTVLLARARPAAASERAGMRLGTAS